MKGRFGGTERFLLPNTSRFYDFIGRYLQEVAALFPSPYFHAGLDEFWDFNLRTLPKAARTCWRRKAVLRHIQIIHELLKKLASE